MKHKKLVFALEAGVLILLLIVAAVIATTPDLFSSEPPESGAAAENIIGDVSVRRSGNNYTLKNGVILYAGDEVIVGRNAQCEVVVQGRARVTLNQDSRLLIREQSPAVSSLTVREGVAFFDLVSNEPEGSLWACTEFGRLSPESGAVFSLEAYTGTQTVNIYRGAAELQYADVRSAVTEGEHVTMFQTEDQQLKTVANILATELHPFLLDELIARGGLCFDDARLRTIVTGRRTETGAAAAADAAEDQRVCTVEIRCDTLPDAGKPDGFTAPEDGVLLPATPVKFTQGENAYEILRRVCKAAGIKLDYNYYPMIGGYYVTGIDGLSAGDYGGSSGWLYKINGWFPNYSISRYEVVDGDVIVWMYSCEGGGADLGREEWLLHEETP